MKDGVRSMLSVSYFIDRDRKSMLDAACKKVAQDARTVYEPVINSLKGQLYDLRHEVARLKIYEEFVLGRGRQYGALRRARLRK